jgi:hypothetical protein
MSCLACLPLVRLPPRQKSLGVRALRRRGQHLADFSSERERPAHAVSSPARRLPSYGSSSSGPRAARSRLRADRAGPDEWLLEGRNTIRQTVESRRGETILFDNLLHDINKAATEGHHHSPEMADEVYFMNLRRFLDLGRVNEIQLIWMTQMSRSSSSTARASRPHRLGFRNFQSDAVFTTLLERTIWLLSVHAAAGRMHRAVTRTWQRVSKLSSQCVMITNAQG